MIREKDIIRPLNVLINMIPIDKYDLDNEAIMNGLLIYEIGVHYAKACDMTIREKMILEAVEAEMGEKIRKNPKKYGYSKATDTVIKGAVKTTREWKKQFAIYAATLRKENELKALRESCISRAGMIKVLQGLWENQWYSTDTAKAYKKRKILTSKQRKNLIQRKKLIKKERD